MSDVSALAQEYQSTAELAKRLSDALLVIKRIALRLPGADSLTRATVDESRRVIELFVRALAVRLSNSALDVAHTDADAIRLPPTLVQRLANENRGQLEYYIQDLQAVAGRLRQRVGRIQLDDHEISLIEGLASAADAETSRVFRQMMRR